MPQTMHLEWSVANMMMKTDFTLLCLLPQAPPCGIEHQICDKELLAIVAALKHWQHYLQFSSEHTEVQS